MSSLTKRTLYYLIITAVILFIPLDIIINNNHRIKAKNQSYINIQSNVRGRRLAYNNKYNNLVKSVFKNKVNSPNPIIKSNAINTADASSVQKSMQKLFSIYYTFDNGNDYTNRLNKVQGLVSANILYNKSIFDNDKDSSGGDKIDNLQLHSQFKSVDTTILNYGSDNLKVIADVQYTAWSGNNKQITGEKWFLMTYNNKQHIITGMQPLYRNNDITNTEHMD